MLGDTVQWAEAVVTSLSERFNKLAASQQGGGTDHSSYSVQGLRPQGSGQVLRCPLGRDKNVCVLQFTPMQVIGYRTCFPMVTACVMQGGLGHLCANDQRLSGMAANLGSADMRAVGPS